MSKIKIEKGSVQETLLIPLYGRKMAMDLSVMAATRQYDMAEVCRRYLAKHPNACVMNLVGFKTYSKWNADEFATYIEKHGFEVQSRNVVGSNLAPLCNIVGLNVKK